MSNYIQCKGVQLSSYWRGHACGNEGKYLGKDGLMYCHAHLAIADNTPERFDKARESLARWRKKRDTRVMVG